MWNFTRAAPWSIYSNNDRGTMAIWICAIHLELDCVYSWGFEEMHLF